MLAQGQTVEQVCVGLWNLYTGAFLMRDLENFIDEPIVTDPMPTLAANAGVPGRPGGIPLERPRPGTHQRVLREIFPEEARSAGLDLRGARRRQPAGEAGVRIDRPS